MHHDTNYYKKSTLYHKKAALPLYLSVKRIYTSNLKNGKEAVHLLFQVAKISKRSLDTWKKIPR